MNGSMSCSNGVTGAAQFFEIESSYIGFLGRYAAAYDACREAGQMGGMKR